MGGAGRRPVRGRRRRVAEPQPSDGVATRWMSGVSLLRALSAHGFGRSILCSARKPGFLRPLDILWNISRPSIGCAALD